MAKNFDNYNLLLRDEVVILLKLPITFKKIFIEVFTVKISSIAIF